MIITLTYTIWITPKITHTSETEHNNSPLSNNLFFGLLKAQLNNPKNHTKCCLVSATTLTINFSCLLCLTHSNPSSKVVKTKFFQRWSFRQSMEGYNWVHFFQKRRSLHKFSTLQFWHQTKWTKSKLKTKQLLKGNNSCSNISARNIILKLLNKMERNQQTCS